MDKTKTASDGTMKLPYGKTILMGFAFMASSIAWGVYDPYVTTILNKMLGSSETIAHWSMILVEKFPFLLRFMQAQGEDVGTAAAGFTLVPLFIGVIMTFDNIFGVIFQPAFGKLSDRCHSRFGKRKPFIMIGAPVATASMPRRRPSVDSMAMHRTVFSPMCCSHSAISVSPLSRVMTRAS